MLSHCQEDAMLSYMELGVSHYLINGGGVEYFESEFQNRKSSDFQQYDPAHFLKLSMTPTLYPKIKV